MKRLFDSRNVDSVNSGNNSSENGLNNSYSEISNNSDCVNENLIFYFLLGGKLNNNKNKTEWENLCNYQLKSGNLSDIPFLAKTAAFFNKIMPIVSGQRWLVINRYSTKVIKSAINHISAYAHATERNRNSF
ncbi:hypothetical protein PIROE2DRAFT_1254 [Piromyces sp. E2]|nr:hypothetical protein PIROE2DRAFT_1254 [Piromyces sp. E2]|eukprot:OUM70698.1 hypothetical protein PIROE2DRAFT_1254 [Piromyces sp. E2]